jgi:uncharacterized protein
MRSSTSVASAAEESLYLDSSALMKLVVEEPESAALAARVRESLIASSELVLGEVPRAVHRLVSGRRTSERDALLRTTETPLEGIALVPVEREILVRAGGFREAYLRALDAIHIAAALTLADVLVGFLTYDDRQVEAAHAAGLSVLSPS